MIWALICAVFQGEFNHNINYVIQTVYCGHTWYRHGFVPFARGFQMDAAHYSWNHIENDEMLISCIGFKMGMEKPTVFPKWVTQVQVRYWILAHCGTPRTHTAVLRVYMGWVYIQGEHVYLYFFSIFVIFLWVKQLLSGVSNSTKHRLLHLALLILFHIIIGHPAF